MIRGLDENDAINITIGDAIKALWTDPGINISSPLIGIGQKGQKKGCPFWPIPRFLSTTFSMQLRAPNLLILEVNQLGSPR